MVIRLSKAEMIINTVSNYLNTEVIQPEQIDRTMFQLLQYSDTDLIGALIESHVLREEFYALRYLRCPN